MTSKFPVSNRLREKIRCSQFIACTTFVVDAASETMITGRLDLSRRISRTSIPSFRGMMISNSDCVDVAVLLQTAEDFVPILSRADVVVHVPDRHLEISPDFSVIFSDRTVFRLLFMRRLPPLSSYSDHSLGNLYREASARWNGSTNEKTAPPTVLCPNPALVLAENHAANGKTEAAAGPSRPPEYDTYSSKMEPRCSGVIPGPDRYIDPIAVGRPDLSGRRSEPGMRPNAARRSQNQAYPLSRSTRTRREFARVFEQINQPAPSVLARTGAALGDWRLTST